MTISIQYFQYSISAQYFQYSFTTRYSVLSVLYKYSVFYSKNIMLRLPKYTTKTYLFDVVLAFDVLRDLLFGGASAHTKKLQAPFDFGHLKNSLPVFGPSFRTVN